MASADVTVTIKVQTLGGEVYSIATSLRATFGDIKTKIQNQLGHVPSSQKLLLGDKPLQDASAILSDLGIGADSVLSLVVSQEPLGQSKLDKLHGKKPNILPNGYLDPDTFVFREHLDEFEFMSWQAVCKAHEAYPELLFMQWTEDEAEIGAFSADLYWTTRSDGYRYEYWSAAPGENEYGVLVRIDANSMVAIGSGSDDGLEIFEDYAGGEVVEELIREGWPRPNCWKHDESDEDASDDDSDEVP
jgi:hypothetical protein